MNFPNRIYKEINGEIFEYMFLSQTYSVVDDCTRLIYTDDYERVFKPFCWNCGDIYDEKEIEIFFYRRDGYYINKSKLITDKINQYQRAIEHGKELLKENEENLDKLCKIDIS